MEFSAFITATFLSCTFPVPTDVNFDFPVFSGQLDSSDSETYQVGHAAVGCCARVLDVVVVHWLCVVVDCVCGWLGVLACVYVAAYVCVQRESVYVWFVCVCVCPYAHGEM